MRPLLLLLACAIPAVAETRYEIRVEQASSRTLTVVVEAACPPPACEFQLPVWNATYQVRDFAQYVTAFRAARPGGEALGWRLVTPSRWRVEAAGERVRITYQYLADNPGPFGCSASERHVFLNFAQILMYPAGALRQPMTVAFRNLPMGWKIALELPQRDGVFQARHYDELVDSPAELSAFAETSFELGGKRVRVVVDAEASDYDMARLEQTARKVAAAGAEIMQDVPFPAYTFIYHFRPGGGGGMEHANSTAIDQRPCRDCDFSGITAHEFFHLWNVKRIRPASLEPIDYTRENPTPSLWFSEGVTSTYGTYIQRHAGLLDRAGFLRRLEGAITRYERTPARLEQSLEESSIAAWLERYPGYRRSARSISYYLKGELAGYLLDLAIRHHSSNRRSLDDLMRRLNTEYAQKGRFFEDTEGLERIASELAGRSLREFFDQVVRRPAAIEWNQYLAHAGYQAVSDAAALPSLGLEVSGGPQRGVVTQRDGGGAAEKAGIQVGDRIVSINRQPLGRDLGADLESLALAPGAKVEVELERAGRTLTVAAVPDSVLRTAYRIRENPRASPQEKAVREGWLRGGPVNRTKP